MAGALATLAVGLYLVLKQFFGSEAEGDYESMQDTMLYLGIPALAAMLAFTSAVRAFRLWKIRGWIATKPELAGKAGDIASSAGRMWGIATEQKAVRRLSLPQGWSKETNVPIPGGDVDLLVTSPGGDTFVVEIKSWAGLHRKWRIFGLAGTVLVKNNGDEPDSDPIAQVLAATQAVAALRRTQAVKSVLWLPNGKRRRFACDGVLVVNGGPGSLRRAIGAGWW